MNEKINSIIEQLKSLTLLEASELVASIETVFGVSTAIVGNTNSTAVPTTVQAEIAEEKTEFAVILTEVDATKKIAVLKIVRNITGLGLKESKEIVDNIPKTLKEGVSKDEAESVKKEVEAVGGKVEIK
jgi:large subunit ribosomal protein L7/L12